MSKMYLVAVLCMVSAVAAMPLDGLTPTPKFPPTSEDIITPKPNELKPIVKGLKRPEAEASKGPQKTRTIVYYSLIVDGKPVDVKNPSLIMDNFNKLQSQLGPKSVLFNDFGQPISPFHDVKNPLLIMNYFNKLQSQLGPKSVLFNDLGQPISPFHDVKNPSLTH